MNLPNPTDTMFWRQRFTEHIRFDRSYAFNGDLSEHPSLAAVALQLIISLNATRECFFAALPYGTGDINMMNDLLVEAARCNHVDFLDELLVYADPLFYNSMALQQAVASNSVECVNALYDLSDPLAALQALKTHGIPSTLLEQIIAEREAQAQHQRIAKEVEPHPSILRVRKM